MTKTLHAADLADLAKIATAASFNVHLRRGPAEKINRPAATLRAAIKIADELSAEGGKPAMIYAITPEGTSVFVIPAAIDAERAEMAKDAADDEAMKRPLTGAEIAQLTAIMTGGGYKRANSKAAAEARFLKVAAEKGIDAAKAADCLQGPFDFASLMIREAISGKPQPIEPPPAINIDELAASDHPAAKANAASWDAIPSIARARSRKAALAVAEDAAPADAAMHTKAPKEPKAKERGKRAAVLEAAQRGELPAAPDFSAETHKRFRPKLAQVVAMAEAGDIAGLEAFQINPISSSPKAIAKYRDLAVIALKARKAAA